jgi:glycerol-3-phosphate dehydrogenase (NAD(P)+)
MGAGKIGKAIAKILRKGGSRADASLPPKEVGVEFWDKDPAKVLNQKPLKESAKKADIVFLCVPSWRLREAISFVLPHVGKHAVFVSLSKGIEEKTLKTPAEILAEVLAKNQLFAVLGGPMIAEEILQGLLTTGVVGTLRKETFEKIAAAFQDSNFRLVHSEDFIGVSWCGILKNIYAISFGIADGMNLGGNFKGRLFAAAVEEMLGLAPILGYCKETVLGNAGIGDLAATAFSPYSRNRQVGEDLALRKTGKRCPESEGVVSLPLLISLLGNKAAAFPLLGVLGCVIKGEDAARIFRDYIIKPSITKL